MTEHVEQRVSYADRRDDRRGDFPPYWGTPPGTKMSTEREAWIRANVRVDVECRKLGLDPAAAREGREEPAEVRGSRSARVALTKALRALGAAHG